ncbi:MAG: DUF5615 family PIN-like protein [Deferrisomatales bacterium]
MRLPADMGVSMRIVDWLRAEGHDVTHLRDEGLQRLPNGEIFAKAAQERRVVLTFDLDFGDILSASAGPRVGVVLFRLHNTRSPHVMDRLRATLSTSAAALEEGALAVVEETRHRIRRFP